MIMPNFLVIGAQKAGTTSLYHYLAQHPQIYMSPLKEPAFFDFEGQEPDFCGPRDRELYRFVVTDIESYRQLFQRVSNEIAIGEASPHYLYSSRAPERIKHYIPNAKLIAILRNPVDRAYSGFLHAIRDEREPLTDFAQALREEEKRIEKNWEYLWRYKHMGFYYVQLKRYFSLFARSQIKVYLYEDLNNNTVALLRDICQFLNVDETLSFDMLNRHHVSGIPKNRLFNQLLIKLPTINFVNISLKFLLPSKKLRQRVYLNLKNQNLVKPKLPISVRNELIQLYREDILNLQDLIERDLSKWLE